MKNRELCGDVRALSCPTWSTREGHGPHPTGPGTLGTPLPMPAVSATLELGNLLEPQLPGTGLGLQKTDGARRPTSDRWPGQVLERGARHPGPAHPLPTRLPPAHQAAPSLQTEPTGRPSSSRHLWGRAWGPGHRCWPSRFWGRPSSLRAPALGGLWQPPDLCAPR